MAPIVLFYSNFNISKDLNGGTIRIRRLARSINSKHYSIHIGVQQKTNDLNFIKEYVKINYRPIFLIHYWIFSVIQSIKLINSYKSNKSFILISNFIWTLPPAFIISKLYNLPLIHDSHNIESERYKDINCHFYSLFSKLIEFFLLPHCQLITTVSNSDSIYYRRFISKNKIVIIPNGFDFTYKNKQSSINKILSNISSEKRKINFGFIGSSKYGPNAEAIMMIRKVSHHYPNYNFIIVGQNHLNFETTHNLHFLGYVQDLSSFFPKIDFGLIPIRTSGGTNLKTLAFLGHGIPIIATKKALEGIDYPEDQVIITSFSFPKLISHIEILKLTKQNLNYNFFNKYEWTNIGLKFLDLINNY